MPSSVANSAPAIRQTRPFRWLAISRVLPPARCGRHTACSYRAATTLCRLSPQSLSPSPRPTTCSEPLWTSFLRHALAPPSSSNSHRRHLAAVTTPIYDEVVSDKNRHINVPPTQAHTEQTPIGPLAEYDRRVRKGVLRNDEHQRGIIQRLQNLHDELRRYRAPPVIYHQLESLKPSRSFLASLLGGIRGSKAGTPEIPPDLPRGLYLHGDVGCGKTMMMDLFYNTLPSSVQSKTRIHFNNFMQDVHGRLHRMKMQHGNNIDAMPFVAADIAKAAHVFCFDEFQCADVANAMILRRLLELLMSHGVVLVATSNRHPDDLYKNGIQRESFIPAIELLKSRLHVVNLNSRVDYRKISRPPSGVYHTPLDSHAASHADKWFRFLGNPDAPEPHAEVQKVWGREIYVPRVSGRCAWFTFDELIKKPTSAADYIELVRCYDSFILTDIPAMTYGERDYVRRLITFIDAVYESHAKLVLTTEVPLEKLFVPRDKVQELLMKQHSRDPDISKEGIPESPAQHAHTGTDGEVVMDEETFTFARALSRLTEMGGTHWAERGMGLEGLGGKLEHDSWRQTRSKQIEDRW